MGDFFVMDVFFEIHNYNPREGPGSFQATKLAFSMLGDLPPCPRILDVGCGPGAQTLDLSLITDGEIVGVDKHLQFLGSLSRKIRAHSLDRQITLVRGDMFNLGFKEKSFDIIWSEGAIYIIGFETGLVGWRPLLKRHGYVVISELTWLKPHPPSDVTSFWNVEYPAMKDIPRNLEILKSAGYSLVDYFVLSESAWWNNYYDPIAKKLMVLREKYKDNEKAVAILECEQKEIDLFRKHSYYYGYVFYVAKCQ